jgi:hypothetical protein
MKITLSFFLKGPTFLIITLSKLFLFLSQFLFCSSLPRFHLRLRFLNTLTLGVDSSTFIAELKFTLTGHVITAFIFLYPKFTLGALFEFLAFDKLHELLIVLACSG